MENDVLNDKVLDWKKVPEFAALQNPNIILKTGEKEKKIDMERRIDTVIYGEVDIGYGNWMAMLFYQGETFVKLMWCKCDVTINFLYFYFTYDRLRELGF